jgi:hypothetical protein
MAETDQTGPERRHDRGRRGLSGLPLHRRPGHSCRPGATPPAGVIAVVPGGARGHPLPRPADHWRVHGQCGKHGRRLEPGRQALDAGHVPERAGHLAPCTGPQSLRGYGVDPVAALGGGCCADRPGHTLPGQGRPGTDRDAAPQPGAVFAALARPIHKFAAA